MDSGSIFLDLIVIFFLILLNGFFAGAEISIISIRSSLLKALIEKGDPRAGILTKFKTNPDRFFATVQIGVTIVGTVASAYGGVTLVPHVVPMINRIPFPIVQELSYEIAFVLLVFGISYTSLVLGELVPKSIALHYSQRFALFVAFPLHFFSLIFSSFTRVLTMSSNLILKPFKDRTSFSETRLLAEEIRHLLEEGVKAGTIESIEHEIIENVLEVNETSAREIMIPRVDIDAVPVDADEEHINKLIDFYYSRIPVYSSSLDHVIGILHIKDVMRVMARKGKIVLSELVRPAYFVPETMKIGNILQEMQKRKSHMAIVVDEYGGTAGLLTMEDILEEIIGEIQDVTEYPDSEDVSSLPDGSFMVSGSCSISDFNEAFDNDLPESDSYTSVAGYIIEVTGRFPEVGEITETNDYEFELVKRVRQKLVQFLVRKKKERIDSKPESDQNP
jgi:putative hemolysin